MLILQDMISKIIFKSDPTMVGPLTSVNFIPSPSPI